LDKLLDTIAINNGVPIRKPRPCDVFDVIAGIGAGGWLALLLGRFRMDITACLAEWYALTQCIAPRSRGEEIRMRLLQHCYFDTHRLLERIDHLTTVYGTGERLYSNDHNAGDGPRCRHVFVAALNASDKSLHSGSSVPLCYNLFRSYECPKSDRKLLEGPENPANYKISRAFAVTGAARYFSPPWKEHMANGVKARFSDTNFPKPHNITELALDEMWGIYGTDVPLSVIVNIGPGRTDDSDYKQIAKRFSWGLIPLPVDETASSKTILSPALQEIENNTRLRSTPRSKPKKGLHVRFPSDTSRKPAPAAPNPGNELRERTSFGSVVERGIDKKLRRLETEIEKDIKKKLNFIYPENPPPYFRIAQGKSPKGTAQNDVSHPGVAFDATLEFLNTRDVELSMDEVSHYMLLQASRAA